MTLVIGATGRLGGLITQRLLAAGKDVRILVRHNSPLEDLAKQGMATSAQSLIEAGAEPVFGDLRDRASLDAACAGIEVVITTANTALRGGEDTVKMVDQEGNRNLIEAASAGGVRHFIFTSAMAALNSPVPFLQAKARTEDELKTSGMAYTILAPAAFMEVWVGSVVGGPLMAGQPVTLVGEAKRKNSFAYMADVVAYAIAAMDNPAARNRRLPIGGPEALSWRDVVVTCARVLGRELEVRFVEAGEPVPDLDENVIGLLAGIEMHDSVLDMSELSRTFGIEPTPLEVVVSQMFGGVGS
jgi:NADH dehydrogenase